jgi:hypothetical protein
MRALTGAVPQSSPMLSRTVTGFAVPDKLAFNAAASTANCLPPVGWMPRIGATSPCTFRWVISKAGELTTVRPAWSVRCHREALRRPGYG